MTKQVGERLDRLYKFRGATAVDGESYDDLLDTITDLQAQLSASREKMDCGHPKMSQKPLFMVDNLDEGPQLYTCALCAEIQVERAAVLELAAEILDSEIRYHMKMNGPHGFCEDYGCTSLTEYAKQIRALATNRLALDRYVEEKVRAEHRKTCPKFGAHSEIYGDFQCKRCEELHND